MGKYHIDFKKRCRTESIQQNEEFSEHEFIQQFGEAKEKFLKDPYPKENRQ